MAAKMKLPEVFKKQIPHTTKEDKQEKPSGKIFWATQQIELPGRICVLLPDRTKFIECNDGLFQVYMDGDKLHFRIEGKKIEEMKEFLSGQK